MNIGDFIEVNDDDLFEGDEALQLNTQDLTDKEEKEDSKVKVKEVDEADLIEVDDTEEPKEVDDEEAVEEEEENSESSDKVEDSEEEVSPDELYTELSKELAERGFFPDMDEDKLGSIKSLEDLENVLAEQVKFSYNQYKESYRQNLLQNLVKDGYITKEQAQNVVPDTYNDEDIRNDLEIAKNVVRKYYRDSNVPESKIDILIENDDDLEETALEFNKSLREKSKLKEQQIAQELKKKEEEALVRRQQMEDSIKENTYKFEEFIPGRKLKDSDKEEVRLNVGPTLNKINQEITKYGPILAYLDKYGLLEGNFDKVIKDVNTKSVDKVSKILSERKKSSGSGKIRRNKGLEIDNSNIANIYK